MIYTLSELIEEEESISPIITCSLELDDLLDGGIKIKEITEIFGGKGSGRTTFCYQLALNVQIPKTLGGLESECLFIDTENTFIKGRFEEMAKKFAKHCNEIDPTLSLSKEALLYGVHHISIGTSLELSSVMQDLNEYVILNPRIKLVIIDSIAYPFYGVSEQFNERGKILYEISSELFKIGNNHKIAIVVTNNLTTRFSESGFEYKIPFLGEIWAHIPNVRLCLGKEDDSRVASLKKAKNQPYDSKSVKFDIVPEGIRSLNK